MVGTQREQAMEVRFLDLMLFLTWIQMGWILHQECTTLFHGRSPRKHNISVIS